MASRIQGTVRESWRRRAYTLSIALGNVQAVSYDPKLPLLWSLDFNTNPLCSVPGPDGQRQKSASWRS